MKSSTAFEVTPSDVAALLRQRGTIVDMATASALYDQHIAIHARPSGRIEQAALQGCDMEEQTDFAYEDIACILRSADVLPAIPA